MSVLVVDISAEALTPMAPARAVGVRATICAWAVCVAAAEEAAPGVVTTTSTSTPTTETTEGGATELTPSAVARAAVGTVGAERVPLVELSSRLETVKMPLPV